MSKRNSNVSCCCCYTKAALAGFVATIVVTLTMALMGMNVMKTLGEMMMGPNTSVAMQYIAGGLMHFATGSFLGILYAVSINKVFKDFSPLFRAVVYGTLITFLAMYGMSLIKDMKGISQNPCAHYSATNAKSNYGRNANPCATATNPCMHKMQPQANPPAAKQFLMSWINHLVYALVLAYMLSCRKSK